MRVVRKVMARGAQAEAEIAALRAAHQRGVAPRSLAVARTPEGVALTMARCGSPFPQQATAVHVRQLARALSELHRVRPPAAVRKLAGVLVPPSLSEGSRILVACLGRLARDRRFTEQQRQSLRAWSRAGRVLGRFVGALDDEWQSPAVAMCHGDIKPENLRRAGRTVRLIDFGSVCLAEPAWELAHAALALELSTELEDTLLLEYSIGRRGRAKLGARMQGWRLVLTASVPLQWMEEASPASNRLRARLASLLVVAQGNLSQLAGTKLPPLAGAFKRVERELA